MLTVAQIKKLAPGARADIVAGLVAGWPRIYAAGTTTPKRLQHFMAEMAVESAGFSRLDENLNYSAGRLVEVWPKRFPTLAAAMPFAKNPRALANKVYGGRLGNTQPDDGWRYRGGGLIQNTGRENYRAAGYEDDPDALRTMPGALIAALAFWTAHGLNRLVDAGSLEAERKAINGGLNGVDDLRAYLAKAATIFTTITPPAEPVVVKASLPVAPDPKPAVCPTCGHPLPGT